MHSMSRHSQRGSRVWSTLLDEGSSRQVHAASLLCLQTWALFEVRNMVPPVGQWACTARLMFFGFVAIRCAFVVASFLVSVILR